MIPILSRKLHGLLTDYPYVVLVFLAPTLVGFSDVAPAVLLCRVLPLAILGASLLTRAEWGLIRVVPFKIHLLLDALVGLFALLSPWLFGFSDHAAARNALIVIGLFGIGAGLFSKPEEMPVRGAIPTS